ALVLAAGLPDHGIYPELADRVSTVSPARLENAWLRVDPAHQIATLFDGLDPMKAYPIRVARSLDRADGLQRLALRAEDQTELERSAPKGLPIRVERTPRTEDPDGDGIVDRLDILLGAKKLLHNHARYFERYVGLTYPGGDIPRGEGVCSDTVIRAL